MISRLNVFLIGALLLAAQMPSTATTLQDLSQDLTTLTRNANPSVVQINVERSLGLSPGSAMHVGKAVGSGFVIDRNGYILTTAQVVADADHVTVEFSDGATAEAKLMGSDDLTNTAVIKVDKSGLKPLELGNSDTLQPGSIVLSISNQAGLSNSVSLGVVAGVGRSFAGLPGGAIQISGTVGPGSSGGPVLDSSGRVVGMTTAMFAPTSSALPFNYPNIYLFSPQTSKLPSVEQVQEELDELLETHNEKHPLVQAKKHELARAQKREAERAKADSLLGLAGRMAVPSAPLPPNAPDFNEITKTLSRVFTPEATLEATRTSGNTSFAIPVNSIKPVLDSLKAGKGVRRGWFGALAVEKDGRVVLEPEQGSPSEKAGVKKGDVVVSVDGRPIKTVQGLTQYITSRKPGDKVRLVVERDGKQVGVTVTLGQRPEKPEPSKQSNLPTLPKFEQFQTFGSFHPIDLEDAGIQEVARSLCSAYGKNIIVTEPASMNKRVTIHLKSASFEQAMDAVCSAMDCTYSKSGDTYIIKPKG